MTRELTADELLFFDPMPGMLPAYQVLRRRLLDAHPEVGIRVTKTQISFRSRYIFAMVSFLRPAAGYPREHLTVSFGLGYPKAAPRIAAAVEAAPNRWTHHVCVTCPGDVDGELMGWIEEAYQFCLAKGGRGRQK